MFLDFSTFTLSFRKREVVWFSNSNYSEGREDGCVVSSLSRARPFLRLWDSQEAFWSDDGKSPSHETPLVVSARFWWSFLSTTQNWTQSLSSSVPKPKNRVIRFTIACKGQGRMSAVWVACLSAHSGGLSRISRWLMVVLLFLVFSLLFFPIYIIPHCLQAPQMLSREYAGQHVIDVVGASGKHCRADHVVLG